MSGGVYRDPSTSSTNAKGIIKQFPYIFYIFRFYVNIWLY